MERAILQCLDFIVCVAGLCNVEFGITACRVDGLGLGGLRGFGRFGVWSLGLRALGAGVGLGLPGVGVGPQG